MPGRIFQRDEVIHVVGQQPVMLLALAQRGFGEHALGDVVPDRDAAGDTAADTQRHRGGFEEALLPIEPRDAELLVQHRLAVQRARCRLALQRERAAIGPAALRARNDLRHVQADGIETIDRAKPGIDAHDLHVRVINEHRIEQCREHGRGFGGGVFHRTHRRRAGVAQLLQLRQQRGVLRP